jgi:formylglycine-generating enzyme required for sulfatase activity
MDDLDLGATIKGYIPGQKLFRRYTLTRILGRGGMGIVWLARDEELGRDTALKFLPEVVATDRSALDDLKREVRRAIDLAHPHIVKIHDFVTDGRTAAVSMEYVQGDTLSSLRVDQPDRVFTTAQLTPWVAQLCSALQYAHGRAQVVHRDLKPANLMVDTHGELKVLDFGIAASLSESVTRVSKQAGSSGTPVYMSPQQMMGEKPAVTDDIYALGATLYELLTGKPPFYSGNILLQVQNKLPPTLTERRAELGVVGESIPPEWEATIAACLAKEPKDRPQSASEVLQRLRIGEGGVRSVPTRNPNFPADGTDRTDPEKRATTVVSAQSAVRNPRSAMAKLAIAAGVVLLAAAGWYFGLHAPEQRRIEAEHLRAEQARIETERQQAESVRIQTEREAEAQRIEAARITAEQEAERQRIAAARGGVIVRTSPAGAEVRVGAVALEKSPLTLRDQRLGKYPVRVRLEGYEDWDGELEVKENEFSELNVTLVRSTGAVTLTSDPAGLDYTIKGEVTRTGRTPSELSLPTGRYDITFRRTGWPEQMRTVEVKRNEAVQTAGEFVGGVIELTSTPSGAEVWSGGRQVGTTPYRVAEALPGRYDYELRLARHKPASVAVTVNPRQATRESLRLEAQPILVAGQPYENSIGMKFVPVPGTNVLFSIWETRVQDYQRFVNETRRDWPKPDFSQGPTHPAVMINHDDAVAFCRWLTEKERREGRLLPDQEYRLPVDAEWTVAVGPDQFPWGSQWPPPRGTGNYAGEEAGYSWKIAGYNDGFAKTAPVGSYTANRFGLYDMGGNVRERVGDPPSMWRGASFVDSVRRDLASAIRYPSRDRDSSVGFRVVCAVGSAIEKSVREMGATDGTLAPETGKVYTIPELNLELMPISAGSFTMGSTDGSNQHPVTRVTITKPFWLGKTEVTQAQWMALMGNNPSQFKGENLPVENVNWTEAMEFCRRLTEQERLADRLPAGYVYTLPTEAQWEYACRAGTTGTYAGNLDAMAWYNENSRRSTKPVGTKLANAWGLHDMHGNVWEWCLDWYGSYPGGSVADPTGAASGSDRVIRGAGWVNTADQCSSAYRSWIISSSRDRLIGFRLALAPSP